MKDNALARCSKKGSIADEEIAKYLSESCASENADHLHYWKVHSSSILILALLAVKYLAISAVVSAGYLGLNQRFPNCAPRDFVKGTAKACESCCTYCFSHNIFSVKVVSSNVPSKSFLSVRGMKAV